MSPSDILQLRLANQHLATQTLTDPLQLVAHFGAVQAQDYPAARWALGQRLRNATAATIEQAYAEGKILRTHVLRPTWHFVAPTDIRWLLALTGARVKATMASYTRQLGLDAALIARATCAMARALEGSTHLTRSELGDALRVGGVIDAPSPLLGHLTGFAELDGVICSGPRRGSQITYALLYERVPFVAAIDRDEALAEITRRYFSSHGPATMRDFAWWSGLTVSDGKRGVALNGASLVSEEVDGHCYWLAASSPHGAPSDATHLLPNFDEYTVAYTHRDLFYDRSCELTSARRGDVPIGNVILIEGRIVGKWKRTTDRDRVRIALTWCRGASESQRASVTSAVERYARFHSVEVYVDTHADEGEH